MQYAKPSCEWFTTAELLDYFQISRDDLFEQKCHLQRDIHFKRKDPNNPNSSLLWRLELMEEVIGQKVSAFQRQAMENAMQEEIACESEGKQKPKY